MKTSLSRAATSRYVGLDILKCICAFLIVCIHCPFPGVFGEYFVAISRIAVPVFFMITGFFYQSTVKRNREKQQIIKILVLTATANVLFFLWKGFLSFISEGTVATYISETFTIKNIIKFLVFNDSPFNSHLWYLGAILYVLLIVAVVRKLNLMRLFYILAPILLIGDLILGKYSNLLFHREFSYIIVRNWLFVGIPYFLIGVWLSSNADKLKETLTKGKLVFAMFFFFLTTLLERYFLVSMGLNTTRDHYLSTTLLAVAMFGFFLLYAKPEENIAARIGRQDSTWIYIIHPIIITVLGKIAGKIGIDSVYGVVRPIVVFFVTAIVVDVTISLIKSRKSRQNLRKEQQ